jgi:diadenosine tetraphosphate (Ap4A) HIT family hydrolase
LPAESAASRTETCPFCIEIVAGDQFVYELGTVVALRDRFPVTPGHTLVVPRRHVGQLFDLSDIESLDTWRLLRQLRDAYSCDDPRIEGFNVGVNVGETAGQTVPHVHVHLIPRRRGDTPDPRGGVRGVIPARMNYEAIPR